MERLNYSLHLIKHFHFREFLHDKYNDLLFADTIRLVALSMVSVFIPIFLVEQGFAIKDVALMMLGYYLGSIFLYWLLLEVIEFLGVKNAMIFSYVTTIVMYGMLFNYEIILVGMTQPMFLMMIMFLETIAQVFYWASHHIYFMRSIESKDSGKKLGLLVAVPAMVGIISPFVGSVLITECGFEGAFLVSGIMMIIAAWTLFFSSDIKVKISLRLYRVLDLRHMRKNLLLFIEGVGYGGTVFYWPLLMFAQGIKILSMGFLYLLSNIAYALTSYYGGKMCDERGAKKAGRIGAVGWGLSVIFRALVAKIWLITAIQTMGGAFGGLFHTALDADFLKSNHEHIGNAIMNREFYMYLGRALLVITFLIMLLYFDVKTALISVMVISGMATISLTTIIRSRNFSFDK